MAKQKNRRTRTEVNEQIDKSGKELEEKEGGMEKIVLDLETVRQTLEKLDLDGTAEGADEVEGSIESAEDVTEQEFEKEDENLDRIQEQSQEFEGELQDRRGSSGSDLGKISDASARIETKETVNELVRSKEAALRDIDFIAEQLKRASDARERSKEKQEKQKARVHTTKRSR